MKHVNELATILNKHFNWNKARITCLAQMVKGIIAVKTVNLSQIASSFSSKAMASSSYRRMQRFLKHFDFDPAIIVHFVFAIFPMKRRFILSMNRTNWKLGTVHFNFLVLSITYHGIAIPIYWLNLAKGGNSDTGYRMYALFKLIQRVGKHRIACLVADREFIGKEWFSWLIDNQISFTIRIKGNSLIKQSIHDTAPTAAEGLFRRLKPSRKKYLKSLFWLDMLPIYLSASRSPEGELLIVVTDQFDRTALKTYRRRWEIETLFGCMKSKGFNLEDTHVVEKKKVEKLLFIVVIAFCWAYIVGIERNKQKEIRIKKHGRKSHSLFRYGYDSLRYALFRGLHILRKFFVFLLPKSSSQTRRRCYV
jgi:hypothetical protein